MAVELGPNQYLQIRAAAHCRFERVGPLGGRFVGEEILRDVGIAGRAIARASAGPRQEERLVISERGAVGELMIVRNVQQQDGHLFPVLAGHEHNESTEKNSKDETHDGPLLVVARGRGR